MIKRRKFLKALGAAGMITVSAPLSALGQSKEAGMQRAMDAQVNARTFTVYRLQTRKTRACNACKQHHRYKVFLDREAADQNRAHPGCHCRIVPQQVTPLYYTDVKRHAWNGVIDLRKLYGYTGQ